MILEFVLAVLATFALTVLFARILIPVLKSKKMGQKILDIGPRWHKSKEGTPTMGGICFVCAMMIVLAVALVITPENIGPIILVFCLGLGNCLVGMVDDYAKLVKKQNEGLKPWQKIILQLVVAGLFLLARYLLGGTTVLNIPYTDASFDLGIFYYILATILIVGIVNSVNLTDGVDGLASTQALIVGVFFAICAFMTEQRELSLLSGLLIGGMLGFLVYNFHPARVFMGDTGSLFLGGLLCGLAFLADNPLIILVAGFLFVIEALSDIIQVSVFKLSGRKKRVFLMAPIHHHFEKLGWGEIKVVVVFSIATLVFCTAAYFGL